MMVSPRKERQFGRPGALLCGAALAALMAVPGTAQSQEIEEIRREMEVLQQRLEGLERDQAQTRRTVAETTAKTREIGDWLVVNNGELAPASPVNRVDSQADYVTGGDFPGSFKVPGMDTSLAIYGFVKADVVHNFGARRDFPTLLLTSIIPVDGADGAGRQGDTNARVNASQINIESRTPTEWGELRTHFQFDFFNGDQSTGAAEENSANELPAGLRLAYGSLGPLTVGQDWTAFMDLSAYPETADFEGPNGMLFSRVPQIKWSEPVGGGWSYAVAIDNPSGNFIPPPGAAVADVEKSDLPDLVGHLRHEDGWGHVQLSGQLRKIAYDIDTTVANNAALANFPQREDSAVGWGLAAYLQLDDPLGLHPRDKFTLLGAYGEGIRYIIDTGLTAQQTDGGVNPVTGEIETTEQYSIVAWYQHWWTDTVRSTAVYGRVEVDPLSFAAGNSFERTQYVVGNLFWSPVPRVNLGLEYQYGQLEVKDGRKGEANQIQATAVFLF